MHYNYWYNGWNVETNDSCTSISRWCNNYLQQVDFPTEDEAIEYIDDFEEEG